MQLSTLLHVLFQRASRSAPRGREDRTLLQVQQCLQSQQGPLRQHRSGGRKILAERRSGRRLSQGQMDWVVATFDKGTTAEQRQALWEIVSHVFPVKWKS